jgi:hypothetical protein
MYGFEIKYKSQRYYQVLSGYKYKTQRRCLQAYNSVKKNFEVYGWHVRPIHL